MAESLAPSVRVDPATTTGITALIVPAATSSRPESPASVAKLVPRQAPVKPVPARPAPVSVQLAGTAIPASASPFRKNRQPIPDRRENTLSIARESIGGSAESRTADSFVPTIALKTPDVPPVRPPEHHARLIAKISIPVIAGGSPGLPGIRSADRRRQIYGTSARNADKVYFPQHLSPAAGTMTAKPALNPQPSSPRQIASHGSDHDRPVPADRAPEAAEGSTPAFPPTAVAAGARPPLAKDHYFIYETDTEPAAPGSALAMIGKRTTTAVAAAVDRGKTEPPIPDAPSTEARSSGQQPEDDDAS